MVFYFLKQKDCPRISGQSVLPQDGFVGDPDAAFIDTAGDRLLGSWVFLLDEGRNYLEDLSSVNLVSGLSVALLSHSVSFRR